LQVPSRPPPGAKGGLTTTGMSWTFKRAAFLCLFFLLGCFSLRAWIEGPEQEGPDLLDVEKEVKPLGRETRAEQKIRIKDIRIEGCKEIACRDIRSIMRQEETPWRRIKPVQGYDPFWAEDDRRRMELFYKSRGFYNVKVVGPEVELGGKGRGVKISYRIEEGEPVEVSRVKIVFMDGPHEEEDPEIMRSMLGFHVGDRFELEPYQDSAAKMKTYYQNDAFYRVEVNREALVDPEALEAEVTYRITLGGRYKIGRIEVEGCEKTGPAVVERSLDIKPGDRFRRNEIMGNLRQVQRLPIYREVRFIETVDDEKLLVDITIGVEEGKPREVRAGVGYGSEEGIRVQGEWRHVNFLGGARQLSVYARWSGLLEREEIKIAQPNVRRPGDFIQLSAQRRVEHEEAYTHEALSISPTYHFILTDYLWAELSYKAEDTRIRDVEEFIEVEEEDLAREGLLSVLLGRIDWADVDDKLDPGQGARADLYAEYGGGFLGGRFPYLKVIGEARGYYPVMGPVVGALKWRLGYAEPGGDLDQLPFFLRFYAGGTGSVRGYDRRELGPEDTDGDPIGGAKLWEGSFELRFPIWKDLSGVVFEDSGMVWTEEEDYDWEEVAHGAGVGIRYNTPIGPVSLDLGVPLEREIDFSDIRFHFNIGHTF